MNGFCDLHVHSNHSDGTFTPAELMNFAKSLELDAIALCDHNTVSGLPDFLDAAKNVSVEAVPGVEFSTEYQGAELHILGLFIEPGSYAAITEKLNEMLVRKEQSNLALIESLRSAGVHLDYFAIKSSTPKGHVNRAVIASHMVRLGYCESVKEAFADYLSLEKGLYCPPERLDAFDVIRFIKSIGSVAVLAHPFLNLDETGLRCFLEQAKKCGLDAMETYYPKFSQTQTASACRIAEEYGLLKSGGSDFHGSNKPDIRMGVGRGNLQVPTALLDALKECRKQQ